MIAGNFNLTNVEELNQRLVDRGQHPVFDTDTQAILEESGYYLDSAVDQLSRDASEQDVTGEDHTRWITDKLDPVAIFRDASKNWDGGYALAGILGTGDCFAMRDPNGIRPGYYFEDDEVFAVASERAPLMTVFNKKMEEISKLSQGGFLFSVQTDH